MASYGTTDGFTAWLTAQGHTLPGTAPTAAVLLQRASEYVDATYGDRFAGYPADWSQERAWPRTGAWAYGQTLPADVVPAAVVASTYHAAWAEANGTSLSVTFTATGQVKREKVDVLETEYFAGAANAAAAAPTMNIIDGLLAPLLGGRGFPAITAI